MKRRGEGWEEDKVEKEGIEFHRPGSGGVDIRLILGEKYTEM